MDISYGLDASLRHGALVRAQWDLTIPVEPKLKDYEVLHYWAKPGRHEVKPPIDLHYLAHLANQLVASMVKAIERPGEIVGIDWDIKSIFWKTSPMPATQLSYFMGFFTSLCSQIRVIPVFIPPHVVRVALGRSAFDGKEEVWESVRALPDVGDSDIKDALILSYLVLVSQRRIESERFHEGNTQSLLPGISIAREDAQGAPRVAQVYPSVGPNTGRGVRGRRRRSGTRSRPQTTKKRSESGFKTYRARI